MLVVLMAIIDLGRMKVYAVTRWLWLALSGGMFVAAPAGCEKDCNCHCECGQPPVSLTTPLDRADAAAGSATRQDAAQGDSGAGTVDAKADPAQTAVDAAVIADPGNATPPKEAVTPRKPRRKPAEPAKEPKKTIVPDVPQVAYGPPPILDPGREIQPLYGVPFNPDTTPQLMYGPPANRDKLESK